MRTSYKPDLFIGIAIVLVVYTGCSLLPKDKSTTQDINCRALVRDGANAKNPTDYNYAKKKFNEQCNGWVDSRK